MNHYVMMSTINRRFAFGVTIRRNECGIFARANRSKKGGFGGENCPTKPKRLNLPYTDSSSKFPSFLACILSGR